MQKFHISGVLIYVNIYIQMYNYVHLSLQANVAVQYSKIISLRYKFLLA